MTKPELESTSVAAILCPLHCKHLAGFVVTLLSSGTVGIRSQTRAQRWPNSLLHQIRSRTVRSGNNFKSISSSEHKRRASPFRREDTAMLTGLLRSVKKLVSSNTKGWRGYREKGTLLHCWWEYKLVQPPWRTHGSSFENYNKATIWFSNSIPGHVSGENSHSKRCMNPSVHNGTIYNSQDMEVT